MTNFLFDSLVKVQNHPYTNKNTTIIWSSAVKNLSEWLTTIVMLLQHLDPKLLSAQQLKQESPSMTQMLKNVSRKISTHLVTTPVPLSIFLKREVEKNDGSLHTSLVIDLNSDIPKKQVKQLSELAVTALYYIRKWILYR